MASSDSKWPRWPDGVKGKQLVRVGVAWDVDTLFKTLFSTASPFAVKSQEARGNKEVVETPWVPLETALSGMDMRPVAELSSGTATSSGGAGSSSSSKGKPGGTTATGIPPQGSVRRVGFSAAGMGMKYKTEELQRLLVAKPGHFYTLEGCVSTTATYGDTFRVITRTRLTAGEAANSCELTIESTLVYLSSVNKFVRGCIERGADSGMAKNFSQFVDLLGKEVTVTDLTKAPAAAVPKQAPAVEAAQPAAPAAAGRLWCGLLDAELATQMQPVAEWALGWLPGGSAGDPAARESAAASALAQALAAALLLVSVHMTTRQLRRLPALCSTLPGWAAAPCRRVFARARLPDATQTVLAGIVLVVVLQAALAYVLSLLPPIIKAVREHQAARREAAAKAAADAAMAKDQLVQRQQSEEAPATGTRFEGFDSAFSNGIATAEPDPPLPAVETAMQQTVRAMGAVRDMWHDSFAAILSPLSQSPALGTGFDSKAASPESAKPPPAGANADGGTLLAARHASSPSLTRATTDGSEMERALDEADDKVAAAVRSRVEGDLAAAAGDLQGEPGPRLEEVFENERAQPFRGWGHTWPGHFLPTDRVGHWSARSGAPGGRDSMSFCSVAPRLRPGYEWEEEKWHVDLSGLGAAAVDSEGWSYAVDFNWLMMPPPPGSGRKQVTHFVRRRRWVRTQRPIPDNGSASPSLQPGGGDSIAGASPPRRSGQLLEALSFPKPVEDSAMARLSSSPMPPPSPPRRPRSTPAQAAAKTSSLDLLAPPGETAQAPAQARPGTAMLPAAADAAAAAADAGARGSPTQEAAPAAAGAAGPSQPPDGNPPAKMDTQPAGLLHQALTADNLATLEADQQQDPAQQTQQQVQAALLAAAPEPPSSPTVQQQRQPHMGHPSPQPGTPVRSIGAALRKSMPAWLRGADGGTSPAGSAAGSAATSPKAPPQIPPPKASSPARLAPEQAAAAARLLMAGNRLPGMGDATAPEVPARSDGGHLGDATADKAAARAPGSPAGSQSRPPSGSLPGSPPAGGSPRRSSPLQQSSSPQGSGALPGADAPFLGTLEREPAVPFARTQSAADVGANSGGDSGDADAAPRQRHRLADAAGSGSFAAPDITEPADIEAASPRASAAHRAGDSSCDAGSAVGTSIAAPAAASPSTSAPAPATAPDTAQPASEPEAGVGRQQPEAAAAAETSTVEEDDDEVDGQEEVPSFMEDALGRRAELETAAALGSAEMSSADLALLNGELGGLLREASVISMTDSHTSSRQLLAMPGEAPVASGEIGAAADAGEEGTVEDSSVVDETNDGEGTNPAMSSDAGTSKVEAE